MRERLENPTAHPGQGPKTGHMQKKHNVAKVQCFLLLSQQPSNHFHQRFVLNMSGAGACEKPQGL